MNDKYCANCGAKMDAGAAFCPQCGFRQDLQNYGNSMQQNAQNYGGTAWQNAQNYGGTAWQNAQNYAGPAQQNMQGFGGAVPQSMQGYGMPAGQKNKTPIIIAICAAVAAVIIGAVVIGSRNGSSNDNYQYNSAYNGNNYSGGSSSGGGSSSYGGNSSSEGGDYSYGGSANSGNAWNLSPGEASVTVTKSNGNSVSIIEQEAGYGHSSGLYGTNENYFILAVAFNDTDTITLIVDIFEDYCQQGLSLSSGNFNDVTKLGVLLTSNNDVALYNTYEHSQIIGNGSFLLEEYSANSAVFYIKADVAYNGTVYTLEGYGCGNRTESEPLVLTSTDQWASESQSGICPTCHGSGTCQVCYGLGSLAGETCHGCWGSRACEYCGGTGRR